MNAEDPFFTVKQDVESNMTTVLTMYDSWKHLLSTTNTSSNQEFQWTHSQLTELLKTVQFDLGDLEETVTIVETNPHKFKLDAGEIYKRKQFIALASAKLKEVTDDVNSSTTKGKLDRDKRDTLLRSSATSNTREAAQARYDKQMEQDNQAFIEQNSVQIQMKRQDKHLEDVHGTISVLKEQAHAIGDELDDQEKLLAEVDDRVDRFGGRLKTAMAKMNDVYKKSNDKMSFWLIGGLVAVIVILVVLLMSI